MAHGPCRFRKRDLTTAVDTLKECGVPIAKLKFHKDGGFEIVIGKPGDDGGPSEQQKNEWDGAEI